MNANQVQHYNDSIHYCDKLCGLLEKEKDTIRNCFRGEALQAYLEATDKAIKETKKIRSALIALQAMQGKSL